MKRIDFRPVLVGALLLSAIAPQDPLLAQVELQPCPPGLLAPDHWATAAVYRLRALGSDADLTSSRRISRCAALETFQAASEQGSTLAASLLDRLLRENPGLRAGDPGFVHSSSIGAGFQARQGLVGPGTGEFEGARTGAEFLADGLFPEADAGLAAGLGRKLTVQGGVSLRDEAVHLDQLELSTRLGGLQLDIGRGPEGHGYSSRGAIVLHQIEGFDRVRIGSSESFQLPWFLGSLGRISVAGYLGRLGERHDREPYFAGGEIAVEPHRRVVLSIHRGTIFGGEGYPLTAGKLANTLIGRVKGIGFEDQVVSLSGRWHLPTETVLPAVVYFDWGAEDAAGAWTHVPGRLFGISLPSVPLPGESSVSVEFAQFAPSCCFNPQWYRHWAFPGSWAYNDRPLGHPLGGNGSEISLSIETFAQQGRWYSEFELYRRNREEENLFVPGRSGAGFGGLANVAWDVSNGLRLEGGLGFEYGDDWDESLGRLEMTYFPNF